VAGDFEVFCLDSKFLRMRRNSIKFSAVTAQSTEPNKIITIASIGPLFDGQIFCKTKRLRLQIRSRERLSAALARIAQSQRLESLARSSEWHTRAIEKLWRARLPNRETSDVADYATTRAEFSIAARLLAGE
jgi:hypothetical protein